MSPRFDWFSRLMLFLAGILGSGGVIAAAAASHTDNQRILGAVALIALPHAAALLALGLVSPIGRLLRAGAIAIAVGACLFSVALTSLQLVGITILPMAAPAGGTAIIAGWVMVAIAGLVEQGQR